LLATITVALTTITGIGQVINPPVERCTNAIHVCGNYLNGLSSTLPIKNIDTVNWPELIEDKDSKVCGGEGTFQNTVWYSFYACAPKVHLRIIATNCALPPNSVGLPLGMQAGIYKKCKHTASVDCADFAGSASSVLELEYDQFVPGELVFIVLDGQSSSVCDYRIEVLEGVDMTPPTKPDTTALNTGAITGRNIIDCKSKGQPIKYTLTKPECVINNPPSCTSTNLLSPNGLDSIKYIWNVTPDANFLNNDSIGTDAEVIFDKEGDYTIEVRTVFHPAYGGKCENGGCGKIEKWKVKVLGSDTTYLPPMVVCPNTATIDFCGNIFTKDTTIFCYDGLCDVTAQKIEFLDVINVNLGKKVICSGDFFEFQNVKYTTADNYSVPSTANCAEIYNFEIEVINLQISIDAPITTINCLNKSLSASATASVNGSPLLGIKWFDQTNQLVGNQSTLITKPGIYTAATEYSDLGQNCKISKSITIDQDVDKPAVVASIPKLNCNTASNKILSVQANKVISSTTWSSPLGLVSNTPSIVVDSANAVSNQPYLLRLVGDNGCVLDTTFLVPYNYSRAQLDVAGEMLTCLNPSTKLQLSTDIPIDNSSITWRFNNGSGSVFICCDGQFVTTDQNQVGKYSALAKTSESQCLSTGAQIITEDKIKPVVNIGDDLKWFCNTEKLEIKPVAVDASSAITYRWTSAIQGSIEEPSTGAQIQVNKPGVFVINVQNASNGCQKSDTINVVKETNVPNAVKVELKDLSCFEKNDGSIQIIGSEGGNGPFTYFVNGKQVPFSGINANLSAGDYVVTVKDRYGCEYSENIEISEADEFTIDLQDTLFLEYNESAAITFESSFEADQIKLIEWLDAQSGNVISQDDTLYHLAQPTNQTVLLILTNNNGCKANARINIFVDQEAKIYFPNVFSPNGDGINDRYTIFKSNKTSIVENKLYIYDRFGNLMFADEVSFNDQNSGWDGKLDGRYVAQGVYVAILEYRDYSGKQVQVKESILVNR
jgi:gliding motility-associated-like protein